MNKFNGFTDKELHRMESNYYCIMLGGDFQASGDIVTFTKAEAAKVYNGALRELTKSLQDSSTAKDSKYFQYLIGSLRIVPFRLQ